MEDVRGPLLHPEQVVHFHFVNIQWLQPLDRHYKRRLKNPSLPLSTKAKMTIISGLPCLFLIVVHGGNDPVTRFHTIGILHSSRSNSNVFSAFEARLGISLVSKTTINSTAIWVPWRGFKDDNQLNCNLGPVAVTSSVYILRMRDGQTPRDSGHEDVWGKKLVET